MATLPNGCDWPVDYAKCWDESLPWEPDDLQLQEQAESAAVALLWRATGSRFSQCIGTWYPGCCEPCPPCQCGLPTGYTMLMDIKADAPIIKVTGAQAFDKDDGTYKPWDVSAWKVLEGQRIVVPVDDIPPYLSEINYQYGIPVPSTGALAAGLLALEIGKDLCGDVTCRLPATITSVTRQGVSAQFAPNVDTTLGITGLPFVDSFVSSARANMAGVINPNDYIDVNRSYEWIAGRGNALGWGI